MDIKNSVLHYIDSNSWTGMTTCKEWKKKGNLEKFWNGVHLEEEEKEDLEIRGCRDEREKNNQHGMGRQRRMDKKTKIMIIIIIIIIIKN